MEGGGARGNLAPRSQLAEDGVDSEVEDGFEGVSTVVVPGKGKDCTSRQLQKFKTAERG